MNCTRFVVRLRVPLFVVLMFFPCSSGWAGLADEEREEAIRRTREEWEAFVQTMKDAQPKLEEYLKTYEEWENFFYDQTERRDFARLAELLGVEEKVAKQKWDQVQGYFNELNKAGIKTKLGRTIGALDKGTKVAGGVANIWEFSAQFNPANAKDDPTYGLKLIGDLLTESADKINKVPVVGPLLAKWVRLYGEAAQEYAKALDRLSKKIQENTRQGALCGQSGVWLDQQKAFGGAANGRFAGENCLTYFLIGRFPRLRCPVYVGQNYYFLYDPSTYRGYFAVKGMTQKVYDWHELLLAPRALHPDWLASRANSLTSQLEANARVAYRRMSGIFQKTDKAWIIADRLRIHSVAESYGSLGEESFVANFLLDEQVQTSVEAFLSRLDTYVFVGGTVRDRDTGDPIEGAAVEFTVGKSSGNAATGSRGSWEMLLEGSPDDPTSFLVAKEGYSPYSEPGGRMPGRAIIGWNTELSRERVSFSISGTVMNKGKTPAEPVDGASVSAAVPGDPARGWLPASDSDRSGPDGSYTLTLELTGKADERTATVTASHLRSSVSVEVIPAGTGISRVDLLLDIPDSLEALAGSLWTIQGVVVDRNGQGIAYAGVTGGPTEVTTGPDGQFVYERLNIMQALLAGTTPSYTLTPSVRVEDGTVVSGGAVEVAFAGEEMTTVRLAIDVEVPVEVMVTGMVQDANGIPLEGATISSDRGVSAVSQSGGRFSLGPVAMVHGEILTLSASYEDPGTNQKFPGGSHTVQFEGRTPIVGRVLVVNLEQEMEISLQGSVVGRNGELVPNAQVAAGGSGATATDGTFELAGISHVLGEALKVEASVATAEGDLVTGSRDVIPWDYTTSGIVISLDVVMVEDTTDADSAGVSVDDDGGDDGLDDAIDEIAGDGEEDDLFELLAAFEEAAAQARWADVLFSDHASAFEQRLREQGAGACDDKEVGYSLVQARDALSDNALTLKDLAQVYTMLKGALFARGETRSDVDATYSRVLGRDQQMRSRYRLMSQQLRDDYGCDEDLLERDGEEVAEGGADPDDVGAGIKGTDPDLVEVCGDGVDNDGDNEIDECDAGCCEGRAIIVVTDCGSVADDIFLVRLSTGASGVTPRGASTTFSDDLAPGTHSVTLQVLSAPDDYGTYCLTITVDEVAVLNVQGAPAEGTTESWSFTVPELGANLFGRVHPLTRQAPSALMKEGRQ